MKLASAATGSVVLASRTALSQTPMAQSGEPADHTIRIGTGLVEVGPKQVLSTATYNGQFPGPLLR